MHDISELPAWERLFKRIVWAQLGDIEGKRILDFGSGEGVTANHFAKSNTVVAIEPWEEMLRNRWDDYAYEQLVGSVDRLAELPDASFDIIICHNVLEYAENREEIVKHLARVLRPDGFISVVKHNRAGRVMQMAVLLDDMDEAHALLDGHDSAASKFGAIRYYEDADVVRWSPELRIEGVHGIRTFFDLQQNQEKHGTEEWQQRMTQLEMRVSDMEEYRQVAFFHHLILKKAQLHIE